MKRYLGVFLILCLAGCSMDNKEVIAAKKECEDAGMGYGMLFNVLTGSVYTVTCLPPETKVQK